MGNERKHDSDDWQPATARPGELYTYEGQIRSVGSFFKGLRRKDPRLKSYRRPMQRTALLVVALAVAVVAIAVLLQALF
jgi:hypothetical protein